MTKILAVTLKRASVGLALALLAPALSGCNDDSAGSTQRPAFVRTEIVRPRVRQTSVTLTGEVQARFRADLAFRVSGRVVERLGGGWGSRRRRSSVGPPRSRRAESRSGCRSGGRDSVGISIARGNGDV